MTKNIFKITPILSVYKEKLELKKKGGRRKKMIKFSLIQNYKSSAPTDYMLNLKKKIPDFDVIVSNISICDFDTCEF